MPAEHYSNGGVWFQGLTDVAVAARQPSDSTGETGLEAYVFVRGRTQGAPPAHRACGKALTTLVVVYLARPYLRDARRPVPERPTGVSAGAERGLQVRGEVTGLRDELRRDPDAVAVGRRRSIVAPARAIAERRIPGEAVLRSSALGDDVDGARSGPRVEGDEGGAREMVGADQREGEYAAPLPRDADGGIADVVVRHRDGSLGCDAAVLRVQHEEGDASLGRASHGYCRIERAPQQALREGDLLHARVVRVEPGCAEVADRTRSDDEPAARTRGRAEVRDAVAQRQIAGLLIGLRNRPTVLIDGDRLHVQNRSSAPRIERPRVRHRPDHQVRRGEGVAEDGVGAEQELGALSFVLEVTLRRRLRCPDRVADHGRVVRVARVEQDRRDVRGMRDERALRDRVDLRAPESRCRQVEFVRGEEDRVRVRPDVRVIAEAGTARAAVVRGSFAAVVLHRQREHRPGARGVGSVADGDVEMVAAAQVLGSRRRAVEREHDVEEALRVLVEEADRIGNGRTELERALRAIDSGRISVETVQAHRAYDEASRRVEDPHHVVDALEHETSTDAERLIGRLDRELV